MSASKNGVSGTSSSVPSRKSSREASSTGSKVSSTSSVSSASSFVVSQHSWSAGSEEEHVQHNLARMRKRNPSGQFAYSLRYQDKPRFLGRKFYHRTLSVASDFSLPPSPLLSTAISRKSSPSHSLSSIPRTLTPPPSGDLQQIVKQLTQHGPICVFIRHCEGEHNAGARRNGKRVKHGTKLRDPPLSDDGKLQAGRLQINYPNLFPVVKALKGKFLITNLQRGRDTAFMGWPQLLELENHKMFEIRPELQESGSSPCDTGKSIEEMEKEYPDLDYSRCTPDVNVQKGIYRTNHKAILARAFMKKVQKRKEPILVFVSHGYTIYDLITRRKHTELGDWVLWNGEAVVRVFSDQFDKLVRPTPEQTMAILGSEGRIDATSGAYRTPV